MVRKLFTLIIICAATTLVAAQSFDTLKRSTGKSTLFAITERALIGDVSPSSCKEAITSEQLKQPYNGKTPIYLVMDYLATHPKAECAVAEQVLDVFLSHPSFDVNMRYSALTPPLAYLIRKNYDFLNGEFSTEYISDSVIRKLIEAGASVNTYNSDGSSLMTFASKTHNKYLQDYFLQQNIDLHHTDKQGNDETYKIIAGGDLALLKRLVDEGRIKIDFFKLRNNPKDIEQYPAMYDYLANICSQQVSSYDEVCLYRQKFNLRKNLVQDKYQALAQAECNAARSFSDVLNVEKKYPDMTTMTSSRKRAIYDRDCQSLKDFYKKSLEASKSNTLQTVSDNGVVSDFINNYKNYDPANQMTLARGLEQYITVCRALKIDVHQKLWSEYDDGVFFGLLSKHKIEFHDWTVNSINNLLSKAERICGSKSNWGYDNFWTKALPELANRRSQFSENVEVNRQEYNKALADYQIRKAAELANAGSSSSSSYSSRNDEREEEKPSRSSSSIDPETVEIPGWKIEKQERRNETILLSKRIVYEIRFDDGKTCTIVKNEEDNDYFSESAGDSYNTIENAVAASYVMKKYGKKRKHGMRLFGFNYHE
ncbi:MAG: hypothetical protein J6I37_00960 [Prevotella sp.]|nr:hypothetical protein [Prevotella sp.]